MSDAIRVLLVEDHPLTLQTVSFGLKKLPNVMVVGEVQNGREAVEWVEVQQPDVILMDNAMPVLNGIDATRIIKEKYPSIKIIMLTTPGEQEKVLQALAAGAEGYCVKDIEFERLAKAIEAVMDGGIWLDQDIAGFIRKAVPALTDLHARLRS